MILDDGPIDISIVLSMIELSLELMYADVSPGSSPFDHPKGEVGIDEIRQDFIGVLEDRSELEPDVRRGLCWLLHQEDDVLVQILQRPNMPFPARLVTEFRRYLELLWDAGFANWRFDGFANGDYEVSGLQGPTALGRTV